jgi:hypothetical protein
MPLRDHFRPPLADKRSWDELHGGWPMMLAAALSKQLPPFYVAGRHIHLGTLFEIDVASAVWAPPQPTLAVATDLPDQDEYELRVYDIRHGRRLVAAVKIVSPSNKDRPENRRLFVAKCAALLREQVSVTIVDVVTTRQFNLYDDLVEWAGHNGSSTALEPPPIYAAACRWRRVVDIARLETWAHPLEVGQPLPTLPLWLADELSVPLELEASYEETCRILRIP